MMKGIMLALTAVAVLMLSPMASVASTVPVVPVAPEASVESNAPVVPVVPVVPLVPVAPMAATNANAYTEARVDEPSEWAADEVSKANEYGLVPSGMYHSFVANITRTEFCSLVMALYVKITAEPVKYNLRSPFFDTYDTSVLNAYELGIVKGIGGGLFAPDAEITRQEIAVMLYNAIRAINEATGKNILRNPSGPASFVDIRLTADWAVEAILALKNDEIMIGDDKNRFNPLDNTTKEMAFILVNRIYLIYSGLDAKKAFPAAYTGEILMRIKGSFITAGEYQVVGDIYEYYPVVSAGELNRYLGGEAFIDDSGNVYYIDKPESLSESVSAGYSGGASGGGLYYPIYVLVNEGTPQIRLYIVANESGNEYDLYADADHRKPLLQKVFSDVLFEVPSDTVVNTPSAGGGDGGAGGAEAGGLAGAIPAGSEGGAEGKITFSSLLAEAPELLDTYIWLVRLSRGKVTLLTAISA